MAGKANQTIGIRTTSEHTDTEQKGGLFTRIQVATLFHSEYAILTMRFSQILPVDISENE